MIESRDCCIDDLDRIRTGAESFLDPTLDNMLRSLEQFGVAVIRRAIDPAKISGLIDSAVSFADRVATTAWSNTPFESNKGLTCDITELDPLTAGRKRASFLDTSLWTAISGSVMRPLLAAAVGADASFANPRGRVVVPGVTAGRDGRLPLHIERRAFKFDGIHNIWMALVPDGVRTNIDAPGLQLFIGRQEFFRALSPETEKQILKYMSGLGRDVHSDHPKGDRHGMMYRPRLTAGDAVIFSGFVPHTSYMPSAARMPRIAFDVRIFPRCEGAGVSSLDLASPA